MTPTQELVAKVLQEQGLSTLGRGQEQNAIENVVRAMADAFESKSDSFDYEEFVTYALRGWEA